MIKKYLSVIFMIALSAMLIGVFAGCEEESKDLKPEDEQKEDQEEREPEDGDIEVTKENSDAGIRSRVKWENPDEVTPEFVVQMDTHAGDLTEYDLAEISTLTTNVGDEFELDWEFTIADSHHPEGILTATSGDISSEAENLILEIEDLEEASFEFSWDLGPLLIGGKDEAEDATQKIAVANAAAGSISILDVEEYENIGNYPLVDEGQLSHGIAIDRERKLAYVGGLDEEELIVLDYDAGKVKETIDIGARVHGVLKQLF